jgi:outer membrane protein OmpA-like peptidoglycan-associated protein
MPYFLPEPAVRQFSVVLLSLCIGLPMSTQAVALTFQTRLENVQWTVAGDQFECRLSQAVSDFGTGEFVRRAGEQATFRVTSAEPWHGAGSATLLAAAAPWQPGRGDINLGSVRAAAGEPLHSTQLQAGRLLTGLLEGRGPLLRQRTQQGGEAMEVRLLPAKFNSAYHDYLACTAKLLPVNFEQIKQAQLGFPNGTEVDSLAQAKLDIILQFIQADPSVNRINLDGHSDNSGNRLTNRDLSRRRALAVMEYLKANGVPEAQITIRFHGERYPLVSNNSPANRAKNRRVTVHLQREAVPDTPPQAPAAAPAKSDAAATS